VHPSRLFERRAKMSYDAVNERIRIIDEDIMRNTTEYFDDLFLFKEVYVTNSLAVSKYLYQAVTVCVHFAGYGLSV